MITLAQARLLAPDDVSAVVHDDFQTSALLDAMVFDDVVSPVGGGTIYHTYNRMLTLSSAGPRAIGTEAALTEATVEPVTVRLAEIAGDFELDRVIARMGAGAQNEVAFQIAQKTRAVKAATADAIINGDTAVDAASFDGLNKALTGSSTELDSSAVDWSSPATTTDAFARMEELDELLGAVDGGASIIISNTDGLRKVRAFLRAARAYTVTPGPADVNGAPTTLERYGNVLLFDAGNRAGDNAAIIPTAADGTTDIYAARLGVDALTCLSMAGQPLVVARTPNFEGGDNKAVQRGGVSLGPVAVALKATKGAAVMRDVKVKAATG